MNIKNIFHPVTNGEEKQGKIEDTSKSELLLMTIILTEQLIPGEDVPVKTIIDSMESAGYKKLESSIALRSLKNKKMIELYDTYDEQTSQSYAACSITDNGEKWIIDNKSLLNSVGANPRNRKNGESKLNKRSVRSTS